MIDNAFFDESREQSKEVLLKLEAEKKITADPAKRRKNTFGDKVIISFPPKQ